MTEVILATTGEFYHDGLYWNEGSLPAGVAPVGAFPRLNVADGSGSYWEDADGDLYGQMGVRLAAWTPTGTVTGIRMEYQALTADPGRVGATTSMTIQDSPYGNVFYHSWGESVDVIGAVDTWQTFTASSTVDPSPDPGYDLPSLLTSLAAGTLTAMAGLYGTGVKRVSMVRLVVTYEGGAQPLRLKSRDDGLGGRTPSRGRGGSSAQRSLRNRSYR